MFRSALPRRERHGSTRLLDVPASRCFDPRSREGSDGRILDIGKEVQVFRSALPRRERPPARAIPAVRSMFRSALPRRERHLIIANGATDLVFRSALPRRERLGVAVVAKGVLQFRSALPRRERRAGRLAQRHAMHVSIRAPAKGATSCRRAGSAASSAFRSALPRRERRFASASAPHCFDPRSREGSDFGHAEIVKMRSFDPRSREGSD